jgi:hypothetical protein
VYVATRCLDQIKNCHPERSEGPTHFARATTCGDAPLLALFEKGPSRTRIEGFNQAADGRMPAAIAYVARGHALIQASSGRAVLDSSQPNVIPVTIKCDPRHRQPLRRVPECPLAKVQEVCPPARRPCQELPRIFKHSSRAKSKTKSLFMNILALSPLNSKIWR